MTSEVTDATKIQGDAISRQLQRSRKTGELAAEPNPETPQKKAAPHQNEAPHKKADLFDSHLADSHLVKSYLESKKYQSWLRNILAISFAVLLGMLINSLEFNKFIHPENFSMNSQKHEQMQEISSLHPVSGNQSKSEQNTRKQDYSTDPQANDVEFTPSRIVKDDLVEKFPSATPSNLTTPTLPIVDKDSTQPNQNDITANASKADSEELLEQSCSAESLITMIPSLPIADYDFNQPVIDVLDEVPNQIGNGNNAEIVSLAKPAEPVHIEEPVFLVAPLIVPLEVPSEVPLIAPPELLIVNDVIKPTQDANADKTVKAPKEEFAMQSPAVKAINLKVPTVPQVSAGPTKLDTFDKTDGDNDNKEIVKQSIAAKPSIFPLLLSWFLPIANHNISHPTQQVITDKNDKKEFVKRPAIAIPKNLMTLSAEIAANKFIKVTRDYFANKTAQGVKEKITTPATLARAKNLEALSTTLASAKSSQQSSSQKMAKATKKARVKRSRRAKSKNLKAPTVLLARAKPTTSNQYHTNINTSEDSKQTSLRQLTRARPTNLKLPFAFFARAKPANNSTIDKTNKGNEDKTAKQFVRARPTNLKLPFARLVSTKSSRSTKETLSLRPTIARKASSADGRKMNLSRR